MLQGTFFLTWTLEKTSNIGSEFLPYKFTGKELDPETGLYYYGARYLDPKYSIWLSADPALGEYIPGAPVNDEAKKRNGNLPGMGGVFNTVNLHLYHYAGNNPVKYVDPDGRRSLSVFEKMAATTILGKGHNAVLNNIDLNKSQATRVQIESGGAGYHSFSSSQIDSLFASNSNIGKWGISLPDKSIYIPKDARDSRQGKKALLIHEVFHQLQYAYSPDGKSGVFQSLVGEMGSGNPYYYDLSQVSTLQGMGTLESQAQLVEDFANGYYEGKGFFKRNDNFSAETIQRAQILKDSGIDSKAVNRVLDSQNP